jgi:integrase
VKATISNTLIKQLQPAPKPFEVRDDRLPGFVLRVQPSGVMTYYVQYARGRRKKIGAAANMKPDAARDEVRRELSLHQLGMETRLENGAAPRSQTLRSFIDEEFAAWAAAHLRTADHTVQVLRNQFANFLDHKLDDITPRLVDRWAVKRIAGGTKPATVNRYVDDLKAALNKAAQWGAVEANPIASLRRRKVDALAAPRFLSQAEHDALIKALDAREEKLREQRATANRWSSARGYELMPSLSQQAFADHLKPIVLLSLHTGMRRGEVFNLKWSDVDFERGVLTIHGATAKSGRTRHLPLNEVALATIQNWRAQSDGAGYVFPSRNGDRLDNVKKAWAGVLKDAEIGGFRWHDLRHTFASWLVMRGVDLNTVRELLGHSDYKMTLRYAHLAPEHNAAAAAKLVGAAV